jgi:hypothetical protein
MAMAKNDTAPRVDRRNFLRTIGAGAGASAVAATGVAVQTVPAEARESAADRKKARYKETDHVKAYYRTNRY